MATHTHTTVPTQPGPPGQGAGALGQTGHACQSTHEASPPWSPTALTHCLLLLTTLTGVLCPLCGRCSPDTPAISHTGQLFAICGWWVKHILGPGSHKAGDHTARADGVSWGQGPFPHGQSRQEGCGVSAPGKRLPAPAHSADAPPLTWALRPSTSTSPLGGQPGRSSTWRG